MHRLTLFYLVSRLPSSHVFLPMHTLSNLVRISLYFPHSPLPGRVAGAENPPREQGGRWGGGILDHPLLPSPTSKFMYLWGIRCTHPCCKSWTTFQQHHVMVLGFLAPVADQTPHKIKTRMKTWNYTVLHFTCRVHGVMSVASLRNTRPFSLQFFS